MTTEADPTVVAQLAAYETMDVPALAAEFERLFGHAPRCRHKVWLRRNCAWRVQELAYGGLSPVARTRLEQLMDEIVVPGLNGATVPPVRPRDPSELPIGTVRTREWHGRQIRVTARADGYEHEGRMFKSLSAVATHVTGTKWNGRLFFGLQPARTRK
jgi:Protein of unknown function (DUF2924)